MSLFFRPSVPLYYEFVQGRTNPYPAYLVCGPEASGYCLGIYDLVVHVPTKRVIPFPTLAYDWHTALYDFDCLSLYSSVSPALMVASADTRLVKAGESFSLTDIVPEPTVPYERDLQRVVSA